MEQNLGIVAPVPRGSWVQGTAYEKLNVVRNNGSSYMAIASSTNVEPGVATNWAQYWMLLNSDGINGINGTNGTDGATGPQGLPGPQGEPGTNGLDGIGVPLGGNPGDFLVKESTTAYDTEWKSPSEITVGAATKATQDENGNNIADTYETKNEATQLQNQITVNANNITKNSQLISRNDARLKTIEQVLSPSPYVTDDTVAYIKDLPAGAVGEAEIQIVGGMTYKAQNYFKGYTSATINGVTFTVNSDMSVTVNGTATSLASFSLGDVTLQPGAYFLSGCPSGGSATTYDIDDFGGGLATDIGSGVAFSVASSTQTQFRIKIASGTTVNNITFYPMLNDGSSALPYEPYYEGLRDTAVTEVESVGANRLPIERRTHTTNGITFVVNEDGSVTANGTATNNAYLNFLTPFVLTKGSYYANAGTTGNGMETYSLQLYKVTENGSTGESYLQFVKDGGEWLTVSETQKLVGYIVVRAGVTVSNLTFYPMLAKGTATLPYRPYVKYTLPIPEAVQALDGYGWGINADYNNNFSYEEDGSVTWNKEASKVDMGSLSWRYASSYWIASIPNAVSSYSLLLCEKYTPVSWGNRSEGSITFNSSGDICVTTSDTVNTPSGMLVYALATPEVTDITDLITADNYIDIQGGGSLTFVNQYSQAVPSTIEYGVKS